MTMPVRNLADNRGRLVGLLQVESLVQADITG